MTRPHPLTPIRPSPRGRAVPTRATVALGALVLGLAVAGCTASPSGGSSTAPAAPSVSASGQITPGATATPASTPAGTPTASAAPAAAITLDITLADGQVSPNGKKLDVKVGDTVALSVTSDAADEIHAHTGGDGYELPVRAGQTTTGSFTITEPGSIEVESHKLGKTIVILNAR
ncbi:MAG: uncharacterized protein JWP61_2007 [Friedmanniella sp.]|nr:uncharacterized protein [Friedmanniella sp.]